MSGRLLLLLLVVFAPKIVAAELNRIERITVPLAAEAVVLDSHRPYCYAVSPVDKRLSMIETTTGTVAASFLFTNTPGRIAISPNGRRLYLALLSPDRGYYYFGPQEGWIAEFDLTTRTKVREFFVDIDPFDLAATDSGLVIITSGSGQWTEAKIYRSGNSIAVGSTGIRHMARIALHPSQTAAYAADTDLSPSELHRISFTTAGAITAAWDSPYHGDYPMAGHVFPMPNGTNLISRGGGVFSSSPNRETDLRFYRALAGSSAINSLGFDTANKGIFVTEGGAWWAPAPKLSAFNLESFELIDSWSWPNSATYLLPKSNTLVVAVVEATSLEISTYENPLLGNASNRPPVASFTWDPPVVTTTNVITFDATATSDDTTTGNPLQYRWDLNSDGTYEIAFSTNAFATHHFNIAGTKEITLQVRDRFGALSTLKRAVHVQQVNDFGHTGTTNAAYELQFESRKVGFDRLRGYLYAIDHPGKKLVKVSLVSGLIEREWRFNNNPEAIAFSPDGRRMYVALMTAPHTYYGTTPESGFVAVFDLEAGVKFKEFPINIDPNDILASDNGYVIVSGGSNQSTAIRAFRVSDGATTGEASTYMGASLVWHPTYTRFYSSDNGLSPSDIHRFAFNPATGAITAQGDSRYHGDYPIGGRTWVHPSGNSVISRGGTLLASSPDPSQDLEYVSTIWTGAIEDLLFDIPPRSAMFTLSGGTLNYYNSETLNLNRSFPTLAGANYLGQYSNRIFIAAAAFGRTLVQSIENPAWGSESNSAPTAFFTWSPTNITTLSRVLFDGSNSLDDAPQEEFLFRWDWNGDGTFDTTFTNQATTTRRFSSPGSHAITLQIMDRHGARASVTNTIEITGARDYGDVETNRIPFQLDFEAADVEFVSGTPYAYATWPSARKLVRINLTNGLVEASWSFDYEPKSIAITPDGNTMYVTLLSPNRGYFYFGEQEGWVAEFDPRESFWKRQFRVDIDPFDIVATDTGYLAISSGSGQWTEMKSYRALDAALISSVGIRHMSTLALHPNQTIVYSATTDSSPSDVARHTFSSAGVLSPGVDSPYHGDYSMAGAVFPMPDQLHVVVRGGPVLSTSLIYARTLGVIVEDLVSHPTRGFFAVVNHSMSYMFTTNFGHFSQEPIAPGGRFVGSYDRYYFPVSVNAGTSKFQRKVFPAISSEENVSPNVEITFPAPGQLFHNPDSLELLVTASDEDGRVTNVVFYSNGNSLGGNGMSWNFLWLAPPVGAHNITAVVTDNLGAVSTSAPISIVIQKRPTITLLPPEPASPLYAPANVLLRAQASDEDGSIEKVEFYRAGILVGTDYNSPYSLQLQNLPAGNGAFYAIATDDLGGTARSLDVPYLIVPVPGDNLSNAILLTSGAVQTNGSNALASRDKGEPLHAGRPGGKSIWYLWTAQTDSTIIISTVGSSFDTLLGVYARNYDGTLRPLGSNDDASGIAPASQLKLNVATEDELLIAIDGAEGATGTFQLHISVLELQGLVPNDQFANASLIGTNRITTSNYNASAEAGEPDHAGNRPSKSLWWKWTATNAALVTIDTFQSAFDTVLGVYTGDSLPFLTHVTSNDDAGSTTQSRVQFTTMPHVTYYIAVDGYNGAMGNLTLSFNAGPITAATNDFFAEAATMDGTNWIVAANNRTATREEGEPNHAGNFGGRSLWWKWVAPISGQVQVSTKGSPTDTLLAVYTGQIRSNLTLIAENDDDPRYMGSSLIHFNASAGATYYIAVDAYNGIGGDISLALRTTVAAPLLVLMRPTGDEVMNYRVQGRIGSEVITYRSENFITWLPISTNYLTASETLIPIPISTHGSAFYRAEIIVSD